MWKILVGFIIVAAAALFMIFKAGDKVDMQGEGVNQNVEAPAVTTPAPDVNVPAAAASASTASK
ncbi:MULTISPECIES: hypothetical protein [unclassified Undibacterium]|uniref:hypothetical protein n=1 Tax=unclassified Undibacterium TaxID=2630295 RepID=UPI002AC993C8|nr:MULTISPECIES: hypothetical protein [unclassified Undibacterium]MEB0140318.1 hypothetical protein [Undibacterium sp. CCC2.1]MEB0173559.1 hypothetical protein [Undibacterium sp. CCC1.1]MEB0177226.1 hypothetical protein [Undibacterium sp. CCC3.4]MEB0216491.1 hypothetical protein [Undibacterium sp. 5I2]WPX43261.1 hypothetical protein RHM61_18055 [Undibacterium sp. CCC3.4]